MSGVISNFFSADHDRLDSLFAAFQRAIPENPSKAIAYFRKFKEGLIRHIEWEEQLLFPRFESATGMFNAGPTKVMVHEHVRIKSLLEEIEMAIAEGEECLTPVESLLQLLGEHNMKEEKILYFQCDRLIPQDEIDNMLLTLA